MTAPVRPVTAQAAVLRSLRADMAAGVLPPGAQLVQEDLAARYGVSRVPLREALKTLESEGHVTYHPHRGYFVTELNEQDLREVYRIRELLEDEALGLAVVAATDEDVADIAALEEAIREADDAGSIDDMTAANRRFHFAILELSGRPRLVRMIRILWDATDAYRAIYYQSEANRHRVHGEHRQMVEALRLRDAAALCAAQAEHRRESADAVSGALARWVDAAGQGERVTVP